MKFPLFSSKRLGIDLGTSNSLVWSSGEGVVLSEPSVVAVDSISGKVVAVGSQAYELLGRTGPPSRAGEVGTNLVAQKPLREGVVADFLVCEAMLKYFMDRVLGSSRIVRPEVMVCVPAGITQVERRAVLEAALSAGAKTAYLIEQPLAAALGAKLPIDAPFGSMIVDIGGGSTGSAVVSVGGIVVSSTAKVGGAKLDEAIATYMRRTHNLIIGERMAEDIKIKIGSAVAPTAKVVMEARGRDAISGLPKTVSVSSSEISEAMGSVISAIIACVKSTLEQTPPELASDIIDRGIVMTGGTALLKGLDRVIASQTNVPAHVAEDAMQCVVYGCGIALENIETWKRVVATR